jgi:hypothetical protein
MSYQTQFRSDMMGQEIHQPEAFGVHRPHRLDRRENDQTPRGADRLMDLFGIRFIG